MEDWFASEAAGMLVTSIQLEVGVMLSLEMLSPAVLKYQPRDILELVMRGRQCLGGHEQHERMDQRWMVDGLRSKVFFETNCPSQEKSINEWNAFQKDCVRDPENEGWVPDDYVTVIPCLKPMAILVWREEMVWLYVQFYRVFQRYQRPFSA